MGVKPERIAAMMRAPSESIGRHMPSSKRGESSPYSEVDLAALENSIDNAVSKETMSYVRDRG
jgi:hypothetical protein